MCYVLHVLSSWRRRRSCCVPPSLSALADNNVLDTSRCVYLYVCNENENENENESASIMMIMIVIMIESENEKTDGPTHTMHAYCIVWK